MTPRRLPRPGEVVEPCRLCGAALELSVENPRRVCAACGEINLPSDHPAQSQPAGGLGPSLGSQLRGLVEQSRRERVLFWVTAVPTALGVPVFIQFFLGRLFARGNSLLLELAFALLVLLTITVAPALALGKRRKLSVAPAVMFWTLGFLVGAFLGVRLLLPLQLLLTAVSR